jgi:hypothetical protein
MTGRTPKTIRLIAPIGVTSLGTSHGTFGVDAHGHVDVPEEALRDAVASGFAVAGDVPAHLIETVNAGIGDRENTASNSPGSIAAASGAIHLGEDAQPREARVRPGGAAGVRARRLRSARPRGSGRSREPRGPGGRSRRRRSCAPTSRPGSSTPCGSNVGRRCSLEELRCVRSARRVRSRTS